jgi:radical SAM-linked protein
MRLRLTFSKSGPLIYVGNLDLLTIWERAARRAGLDLEYSRGFHPQPKIQFAAPLPLGFSSRCEILDMRLNQDLDISKVAGRLQSVLPAGLAVGQVESIEPGAPALPSKVQAAEYEIDITPGLEKAELERRIDALLDAPSLPRQRRGKRYDLRPLIERMQVSEGSDASKAKVLMRLSAKEGATGRPDEVLDALGVPRAHGRIERTALLLAD